MQIVLASCCCKLSTTLSPATVNFSTVLNAVQSPSALLTKRKSQEVGGGPAFFALFAVQLFLFYCTLALMPVLLRIHVDWKPDKW